MMGGIISVLVEALKFYS